MRLNYIFNYSYISNVNESYFTYSLYNNSIISRFVIDSTGQINQLTWSERTKQWNLFWSKPEQPCGVYGICGPFGDCNQTTSKCECLPGFVPRSSAYGSLQDSTVGCVRSMPLKCGSKFNSFSPIQTTNLPDNPRSSDIDSAEKCKSACEDTCYCNAYAFDHGCQLWYGDIMDSNQFTSQSRPATFYLRHAATEISSPIPKVRKRNVLVRKNVVPVSILVAIIMGVLGYMYLFKRNKANKRGRLKGLQGVLTGLLKSKATYNQTPNTKMFDDGKTQGETQELQIFNFACLSNATNNFCLKNKLGEGGFGPVYK
ncbi:hypothetical protein MKX01_004547, partial [Papaver californicum]